MNRPSPDALKAAPLLWIALGAGIGAALMFIFNPNRDKGHMPSSSLPKRQPQVSDRDLEQTVRAEFHRRIQHAKSIRIDVQDGVVTVSGPILVDEVDKLISCIKAVPGVKRVEDHLQAHQTQQGFVAGEGKPYLQ